jgi:hypothetical protein
LFSAFGPRPPVSGLRSPVSGLRSPVSGLRSPVSGLWSPASGPGLRPWSPASGPGLRPWSPASGLWSPASGPGLGSGFGLGSGRTGDLCDPCAIRVRVIPASRLLCAIRVRFDARHRARSRGAQCESRPGRSVRPPGGLIVSRPPAGTARLARARTRGGPSPSVSALRAVADAKGVGRQEDGLPSGRAHHCPASGLRPSAGRKTARPPGGLIIVRPPASGLRPPAVRDGTRHGAGRPASGVHASRPPASRPSPTAPGALPAARRPPSGCPAFRRPGSRCGPGTAQFSSVVDRVALRSLRDSRTRNPGQSCCMRDSLTV